MDNRQVLYGESMYPVNTLANDDKELELVYLTGGDSESQFCLKGSLPKDKVQGKMVICDRGVNGRSEKGQVVNEASSTAMILENTELNLEEDSIDVHVLPATLVGLDESIPLKSYINSTTRPLSQIQFGETIIGKPIAPALARFSKRWQSFTNLSIHKPDFIAPTVNIIAAWPQNLWSDKPSREHQKTELLYHVRHLSDTSSLMPVELQLEPVQLAQDGRYDSSHHTRKTST